MKVKKVDFKSPNADKEFTRSILETGFAVIENHPIPHDLIFKSFRDWEEFFSMQEWHKEEYLFDRKRQSGFFPFRSENAKDYSVKDLKEFFHCYRDTRFPDLAQESTRLLFNGLDTMGRELLRWIDKNSPAVIRRNFSMPLEEMSINSPDTLLRPIHYPPISGNEEVGAVRAAAHEDINLITLLPAASAPGLQVLDLDGEWHNVECDPGTIAINSGDMLKMASADYYPSTTHRVVNPEGGDRFKPRFSMPLFIHPNKGVRLSKTHTAGEYLEERLREIGLLTEKETILDQPTL